MPRLDLQVAFTDKEQVKQLGARWDSEKKIWFIPDGVDTTLFQKWLPKKLDINIRSPSYFIIQSFSTCWVCGRVISVFAFLLPAGHETIEFDEDEIDTEQAALNDSKSSMWVTSLEPTIIHYVSYIPSVVAARMQKLTLHYRINFSKTTQSWYWMNHCEYCGMKQGDFEMFSEPEGAFFPIYESDASKMTLHEIAEPIWTHR